MSAKFKLPSSINFSLNDCNALKRTGEASSVPMWPSSSEMFPITPISESSYNIKRTHISTKILHRKKIAAGQYILMIQINVFSFYRSNETEIRYTWIQYCHLILVSIIE
jgi:hypothetical protein